MRLTSANLGSPSTDKKMEVSPAKTGFSSAHVGPFAADVGSPSADVGSSSVDASSPSADVGSPSANVGLSAEDVGSPGARAATAKAVRLSNVGGSGRRRIRRTSPIIQSAM